jgi:hypothetical protein
MTIDRLTMSNMRSVMGGEKIKINLSCRYIAVLTTCFYIL